MSQALNVSICVGAQINIANAQVAGFGQTSPLTIPPGGFAVPTQRVQGTAPGQVNVAWNNLQPVAPGGTVDLDLTNLTGGSAPSGTPTAFAKVYDLSIYNPNNTPVVVGGDGTSAEFSGPFSHGATYTIPPGACVVFDNPVAAGWAVGSTSKLFKLDCGASGGNVSIGIAGQ